VVGVRSSPDGHTEENLCTATTYYGRMQHDGAMDFWKELKHPETDVRGRQPIWDRSPLRSNQWIGMKLAVYNVNGDRHVKLELYQDLDQGANGGNWEKMGEYTDTGGWAPGHDCSYAPDFIPTEGGGVVFIRNTGVDNAQYKWFSVREITAP
jgi:hypothetical protein